MQLFESYEFISRAVVALVLLALLIFYIISLRLTVKRQVRIINSLSQQYQNLLYYFLWCHLVLHLIMNLLK